MDQGRGPIPALPHAPVSLSPSLLLVFLFLLVVLPVYSWPSLMFCFVCLFSVLLVEVSRVPRTSIWVVFCAARRFCFCVCRYRLLIVCVAFVRVLSVVAVAAPPPVHAAFPLHTILLSMFYIFRRVPTGRRSGAALGVAPQ